MTPARQQRVRCPLPAATVRPCWQDKGPPRLGMAWGLLAAAGGAGQRGAEGASSPCLLWAQGGGSHPLSRPRRGKGRAGPHKAPGCQHAGGPGTALGTQRCPGGPSAALGTHCALQLPCPRAGLPPLPHGLAVTRAQLRHPLLCVGVERERSREGAASPCPEPRMQPPSIPQAVPSQQQEWGQGSVQPQGKKGSKRQAAAQ